MTTKPAHDKPILVTGAADDVGGIGRNVTGLLLVKGHRVRAMVRHEDARAEALRQLGAELIQGDLTDLNAMHRARSRAARVSISECRSRRPTWKPRSTPPWWRAARENSRGSG